ncbi:hypothetical protein [Ruminococcus sp.]|uniref:hypothetical protein n=1 Tax=Ruminococcus sp. TaxID=41978 RepID=UPI002E7888D7|nr:hypothetical protein [Ruminococcus sp.]MEE1264362.1 hypothetical protein [Ruminococcus sp.]
MSEKDLRIINMEEVEATEVKWLFNTFSLIFPRRYPAFFLRINRIRKARIAFDKLFIWVDVVSVLYNSSY